MKLAAENNNVEIVEILREAAGGEIPDDAKLQQLLRAMYEGGNRHYHHHHRHHHHLHHHHHQQLSKSMYEGDKEKFCDLLNSLSPDLVRLKNNFLKKKSIRQVSGTSVNSNGSLLQSAVFLGGKTDFVRLLLEHGWEI